MVSTQSSKLHTVIQYTSFLDSFSPKEVDVTSIGISQISNALVPSMNRTMVVLEPFLSFTALSDILS